MNKSPCCYLGVGSIQKDSLHPFPPQGKQLINKGLQSPAVMSTQPYVQPMVSLPTTEVIPAGAEKAFEISTVLGSLLRMFWAHKCKSPDKTTKV